MNKFPTFFDFIENKIHDKVLLPIFNKRRVLEVIKSYNDEELSEYLLHFILRKEEVQKEIGVSINNKNVELFKKYCLELFYKYAKKYLTEANT
jgi:hypothetical protein